MVWEGAVQVIKGVRGSDKIICRLFVGLAGLVRI